ncbi:MAG: hypothetical protein K0Q48_3357, partial [Bacillota bacterium]|nr:hypothetical protein [Bacillota bacterium]
MKSPIRLMTIKSTGLRNVGKVFLWVVLAFLLFKGVAGILDNRGQEDILKTIDEYRIAAEQREAARSGAAAFAENFIYEYYTFDGKYNTGYDERVAPYLAGSMNIAKPMGNGAETNVLSAKTTKISFVSENRMDIDVSAKIQYTLDGANTSDGAIQIR